LPPLDPPADGWPAVARALADEAAGTGASARRWAGWLAVAAGLILVVGVVGGLQHAVDGAQPTAERPVATQNGADASMVSEETLDGLIAMSQALERQVRNLRERAGPMPAASTVYVAELEDLVAQVDNELSFSPDSVNLWGQRVNLLLDLAQLYQHQWEREYGRIASL
jgi:hypothetical protein